MLLLLLACNEPSDDAKEDILLHGLETGEDSVPDGSTLDSVDCEDAGYADGDGDGYGAAPLTTCDDTVGVAVDGDCDDGDPALNPSASESCDGADEDCDGLVDEGALTPWYPDADGDGYGDPSAPGSACPAPPEAVPNGDDCNDAEPLAWHELP